MAECFGGNRCPAAESVGKRGRQARRTGRAWRTGREEWGGGFGDVIVSERGGICAGDGGRGGACHGLRFAIRRWRTRPGSVSGSVFQEREARGKQVEFCH